MSGPSSYEDLLLDALAQAEREVEREEKEEFIERIARQSVAPLYELAAALGYPVDEEEEEEEEPLDLLPPPPSRSIDEITDEIKANRLEAALLEAELDDAIAERAILGDEPGDCEEEEEENDYDGGCGSAGANIGGRSILELLGQGGFGPGLASLPQIAGNRAARRSSSSSTYEWKDQDGKFTPRDLQEFGRRIRQRGGQPIVIFFAKWCGHCKRMLAKLGFTPEQIESGRIPSELENVLFIEETQNGGNKITGYPTVWWITEQGNIPLPRTEVEDYYLGGPEPEMWRQ